MSNIVAQDEDGVFELNKDDTGAPEGAEQPVIAESSAATDASNPQEKDSVSIVRDAVEKRETDPKAASSAEIEEKVQPDTKPLRERDDEGFSDVPFNKHPRFQELLRQRNEAKVDAERYQNVEAFLQREGLSGEEAAELFEIGGLMKRDPAAAWARIKPTIQNLLIAAGEVLSPELKQRVDAGEISRDDALQISRSNRQIESMRSTQTFDEQRRHQQVERERQTGITNAVTSWENDRRTKDPNFEAKLPALQREIAYLHATEGKPSDAAGVSAQLKRAYEAVNASLPAAAAPQRPRRPITPLNGGSAPRDARPEPKSTLDIIRANRRA